MKKEKRELQKGIFASVEVCPKCEDEWIDEKGAIYYQIVLFFASHDTPIALERFNPCFSFSEM